jgi:hypothetical protein
MRGFPYPVTGLSAAFRGEVLQNSGLAGEG